MKFLKSLALLTITFTTLNAHATFRTIGWVIACPIASVNCRYSADEIPAPSVFTKQVSAALLNNEITADEAAYLLAEYSRYLKSQEQTQK